MTDIGIVLGPKNILDVVKIVIPGVVITGVHCSCNRIHIYFNSDDFSVNRYMAYEEKPKEVMDKVDAAQKRIKDIIAKNRNYGVDPEEEEERQKHSSLIGQLK